MSNPDSPQPEPVPETQFVLVPKKAPRTEEQSAIDAFPFPLIAVPGEEAEARLLEMRVSESHRGVTPVIVGDEDAVERHLETYEMELSGGGNIDPVAWLAERRAELLEDDEEYFEEMKTLDIIPGNAEPMTDFYVGADGESPLYIALVPTSDSTMLPILLKYGNWNSCPGAFVHTAVARRWRDLYGAEIAVMTSDTLEFTVARPPATDEQAEAIAWEQYLYCGDIVDQGVGSIATLAVALRHSTRWFFWWD